ncbi:MAG: formyltetrahydrofolate-dependent phosphoribosylglycinamide formyltransferase [Ferruginibacter sp.]|nr:formyltetrahydrofolate-dependent phosphoribosylglycinamide formyltransferase [Ferruginibacter sp.]
MFQKLQQKWKVNGGRLLLIILTFALGGSLCGLAGRKLLGLTSLEKNWLWVVIYIVLISVLWPVCVLLVSVPLGQFRFFRNYIGRLFGRMAGKKASGQKTHLAIFASGAGSNARRLIEHFQSNPDVNINLIVCNKPDAGVIQIAKDHHIEVCMIERETFFSGTGYVDVFKKHHTDWIILAGFLWKIPPALIAAFPNRIVNIHPALLPKYGGKGMYGKRVHEAVIDHNETESGISIHFVDEFYDHGKLIFQARCPVTPEDTADTLAEKIHQLEHLHYPIELQKLLQKK